MRRLTPAAATAAMRRALQLAAAAGAVGEVPIGAVVVTRDGAIVGAAANAQRGRRDGTAHAEVAAISAALFSLGSSRLPPGTTLVVTLEPCTMCLGAAAAVHASAIVYGAASSKFGAVALHAQGSPPQACEPGSLPWRQVAVGTRTLDVAGGVCADEAAVLLQRFFVERRPLR